MLYTIFNGIVLAGIIQGFIFGFIIVSSKKNRVTSNFLLASLIVSFALNNLQYLIVITGLISSQILYTTFWIPLQLVFAPLVLIYSWTILYESKPISKLFKLIIFAPFYISLLVTSYFKYKLYGVPRADFVNGFKPVVDFIEFAGILMTLLVIGWLLFKIFVVDKHQKFDSSKVQQDNNWLRNFLVILFILTLAWLYVAILIYVNDTDYKPWYTTWIGLTVVINWAGHVGLYKYGINEKRKKIRKQVFLNKTSSVREIKTKNEHLQLFEKLLTQEKYYLDPDLSIDKMAAELNISKSHLSRLINTELQCSFTDFINEKRIDEAKNYLKHPDFKSYTLVAIGLEAGFSSKTAFNTTFKKLTGLTPNEFKKTDD